jgi:hypothetical protein
MRAIKIPHRDLTISVSSSKQIAMMGMESNSVNCGSVKIQRAAKVIPTPKPTRIENRNTRVLTASDK